MALGLLVSDSYGLRTCERLSRRGVGHLRPVPGLTIGDVLDRFLGPDGNWDHPQDPDGLGDNDVGFFPIMVWDVIIHIILYYY